MRFINAELRGCGRDDLSGHEVIDTLKLARTKFPGSPASLDALCRRFGVDNSGRELHGALLDSELLAGVYLELMGGRQPGLVFAAEAHIDAAAHAHNEGGNATNATARHNRQPQKRRPDALASRLSATEEQAHQAFLEGLPQRAIWLADD